MELGLLLIIASIGFMFYLFYSFVRNYNKECIKEEQRKIELRKIKEKKIIDDFNQKAINDRKANVEKQAKPKLNKSKKVNNTTKRKEEITQTVIYDDAVFNDHMNNITQVSVNDSYTPTVTTIETGGYSGGGGSSDSWASSSYDSGYSSSYSSSSSSYDYSSSSSSSSDSGSSSSSSGD